MKKIAIALGLVLMVASQIPAMAAVSEAVEAAPAPVAAVSAPSPAPDFVAFSGDFAGGGGGAGYSVTGYAPAHHINLTGPDAFSHNVRASLPDSAFVQTYTW